VWNSPPSALRDNDLSLKTFELRLNWRTFSNSNERHSSPLWRFWSFGGLYKCQHLLTYLLTYLTTVLTPVDFFEVADITTGLTGHPLKLFKQKCNTLQRQRISSAFVLWMNETSFLNQGIIDAPSVKCRQKNDWSSTEEIWQSVNSFYTAFV